MSAIINGDSPSITFSDGTTQATSAIVSGKVPYTNLPAGSVLQVVNSILSSIVSVSNNTLTDTGLTATITPKFASSKILIIVSHNGIARTGSGYFQSYLVKGSSTTLLRIDGSSGYTGGSGTSYLTGSAASYLDSPATTSAVTYKTQMQMGSSGSITLNQDNAQSSMTILEIAA